MKQVIDHKYLMNAFLDMREKILEVYHNHNGEPKEKPLIDCPVCGSDKTGYSCAWNYNKHIRFYCDSCKLSLMQ